MAFIGMVIVNFDVVMVGGDTSAHQSSALAELLQGRAAATFVILAGIGLGLASSRKNWSHTLLSTLKRATFLLILGLLNLLIFDADIIHYYAFYFLFGAVFLNASNGVLWLAITGLVIGFVGLTGVIDYDAGWNWDTYTYDGLWEPRGFIRNLFFNGWHPVVPWLAFLLFGIWLSRLDLWNRGVQVRLAAIGIVGLIITSLMSQWLIPVFAGDDPDVAYLFRTDPVPPMPLYMVAGSSAACLTVGLCLMAAPSLHSLGMLSVFTLAGQQTLTLYIAHILIGMGALEAMQMIGGQTGGSALRASFLFCGLATVYAIIWAKFFRRGPIESLMRRIAG